MKQIIKDYFSFSKKERRGISFLLLILITVIFSPSILALFSTEQKYDFSEFKKEIDILLAAKQTQIINPRSVTDSVNHSKFKQYNKNDNFYHKNSNRYVETKKLNISKRKTENFLININTADSVEFAKIRGIGPVLSSRIIKYRSNLGGFNNIEQIKEIYGIDSLKYSQIEKNITLTPINLKKININTATAESLYIHPYIDYKIANSIINLRKQHGFYKEISDIKKSYIIKDDLFQRIAPYLTI